MALKITEECINCGACLHECPNSAIYEGGDPSRLSDGTTQTDETKRPPLSEDVYYITPDKCTECVGFYEEPQCAAVCPVDCCIQDALHPETPQELQDKKDKLHATE